MTAPAPTAGVEWTVLDVALLGNGRPRGDGDTVNLIRKRLTQLGDDWFWVIDVADEATALDWAARASKALGGRIEVRAFQVPPEE